MTFEGGVPQRLTAIDDLTRGDQVPAAGGRVPFHRRVHGQEGLGVQRHQQPDPGLQDVGVERRPAGVAPQESGDRHGGGAAAGDAPERAGQGGVRADAAVEGEGRRGL